VSDFCACGGYPRHGTSDGGDTGAEILLTGIVSEEIESFGLKRLRDKSLDSIALQMHKAGASYREIGDFFGVDSRIVSTTPVRTQVKIALS
jgi:hypothetical protein